MDLAVWIWQYGSGMVSPSQPIVLNIVSLCTEVWTDAQHMQHLFHSSLLHT